MLKTDMFWAGKVSRLAKTAGKARQMSHRGQSSSWADPFIITSIDEVIALSKVGLLQGPDTEAEQKQQLSYRSRALCKNQMHLPS